MERRHEQFSDSANKKLVRLLNNKQINRISRTNFIYKNMYHNHYFPFHSICARWLFERMARWCPLQKRVLWHALLLYLCLFLSLSLCVSVLETHSHKHTNIESRRLPYHPLSHLILLAIASKCRSKNTHMSAERPNSRTLLSQGNHRERERERMREKTNGFTLAW